MIDARRLAKMIHIQVIAVKERPLSAHEALCELIDLLGDYIDVEYPGYKPTFVQICKHGLKGPFFESREG